MGIVDTHLHVIDQSRFDYPWIAGYRQLAGHFPYRDYAREALGLGIDVTMLMEVDVPEASIEAEAAMADGLRRSDGPPIRGAVSSCRPERADFAAFLERQLDTPWVRGFRRVLHVVPDDVSRTSLFRENLRRIGAAGMPFDLCLFSRQLGIAGELAAACPDTQFVLDHCGQPDIAAGEWDGWLQRMTEVARHPNIAVKISGLPAYTGASTVDPAQLAHYVEASIAAFGWDRVVWGSDWPICLAAGTLTDWVTASQAIVAHCSADEQQALFERNARRIYRLAEAGSPPRRNL